MWIAFVAFVKNSIIESTKISLKFLCVRGHQSPQTFSEKRGTESRDPWCLRWRRHAGDHLTCGMTVIIHHVFCAKYHQRFSCLFSSVPPPCMDDTSVSALLTTWRGSQAQGDGPHLPSLVSLLVDYILVGLSVLGSWRKACPDLSALWLPSLKRKGDTEAPRAHSRQEQKQSWTHLC